MKERLNDKIKEIQEFLDFLEPRIPNNLEKKAICERYAEKIIEAIVDLAFLTIRYFKIEIPAQTADTEIFDILAEKNIISKNLSENLKEAKGMRNIITHEYGRIDDSIIYEAVKNQLPEDTKEFLSNIVEKIKWFQK